MSTKQPPRCAICGQFEADGFIGRVPACQPCINEHDRDVAASPARIASCRAGERVPMPVGVHRWGDFALAAWRQWGLIPSDLGRALGRGWAHEDPRGLVAAWARLQGLDPAQAKE